MSDTYKIHPANLEILVEKLTAMQRRARKLKTNPIEIERLGEEMITLSKIMPGGKRVTFQEPRILIRVHGETPKLAGWSLVAKVEYLEDEKLVSCVPGETCPEQYRDKDSGLYCDHCNSNRKRKSVYVLRRGSRHTQVGRQCLQDFLGGKSPDALLAEAEYIFRASEATGEYERMGGPAESIGILEYLCGVAICIRRLGWLSRSASAGSSTSTDAWFLVKPDCATEQERTDHERWIRDKKMQFQDRDKVQAEEALAWAQSQGVEDLTDYLYNLGVACRASYVTRKTSGLVASVIGAHLHYLDREDEIGRRKFDNAEKSREWVGEIKQRQVFEKLTVTKMKYIETEWGTTTLVCFESEPGDWIKWFASRELDDLEVGDVVDIKATPKEHSEYKGVKQTMVTRAVVLKRAVAA